MREIKFRGYCDRDSEWRYGYYITDGKIHEINTLLLDDKTLYGSQIDVDSLGQYTGLKDKNGVEIYEGDIVNIVSIVANTSTKGGVYYLDKVCGFMVNDIIFNQYLPISISDKIEIIGNIYENPELLEMK